MLNKYQCLISKKIKYFNLSDCYDDAFDECLITVYQCILKFNQSHTFYTYVSKALDNKLLTYKINLAKRKEREYIVDQEFLREATKPDELPISDIFKNLNQKELLFIKLVYIERCKVKEISEMFGLTTYSIYSTLKRAKEKIKNNI